MNFFSTLKFYLLLISASCAWIDEDICKFQNAESSLISVVVPASVSMLNDNSVFLYLKEEVANMMNTNGKN